MPALLCNARDMRAVWQVLGPDDTKRVFIIHQGMYFGEVAVLFSIKRMASVRALRALRFPLALPS